MLFALCGPSGSGKTTVLEAALQQAPYLARLVTYTTRHPRPGEVQGRDYHFLAETAFQRLLAREDLICPIRYRGFWYATALADVRQCHQRDTLAVLRPDKLASLAAYTPLTSVYLERSGQDVPASAEDRFITTYKHVCDAVLLNEAGHLDQTVSALFAILRQR